MARNKKPPPPPPAANWLMTFSDMVTLLLCFFVLLNMMSTLDVDKFKQFIRNFSGNPSIFDEIDRAANIGTAGIDRPPEIPWDVISTPADWWEMIGQNIIDDFSRGTGGENGDSTPGQGTPGTDGIVVVVQEGQIIIRCQGEVLFNTTCDILRPDGIESLRRIVETAILPYYGMGVFSDIQIEGHADIRPIPRGYHPKFTDNLVLSMFRAYSVWQYIMEHYDFPKEMIGTSGYGEYRPIPEIGFGTTHAEWDLNRRVEFVLKRNFAFDEEGNTFEIGRPA
jgi:chemotaxis protein MotB